MTETMTDPSNSWILDIRGRLEKPPPRRIAADEGRIALLVPLYVDGGELWTLLSERPPMESGGRTRVGFPGAGIEGGEEVWVVGASIGRDELQLEPAQILRLGELDEIEGLDGAVLVALVVAIPVPDLEELNKGGGVELFGLPLSAFSGPQLVEELEISVQGHPRTVRVRHVGRRQLWGPAAEILELLIARLHDDGS